MAKMATHDENGKNGKHGKKRANSCGADWKQPIG